ncbi:MAG TPA: methyl-accepting chemotaxis protein, partial [Cyanobacteria bacterium UBA8543]|nr:methyl-accepting chemotaxis protein [Cyanobacteria bacterium UBA8543]
MVKQFNTASSGDNQIPDSITPNSSSTNSFSHPVLDAVASRTTATQAVMDGTSLPSVNTPLAYLPSQQTSNSRTASWWGQLSLKTKATALAIALGVVPVVGIGGTSYLVTQSAIKQEIVKGQQAKALENQLALILLGGIAAAGALAGISATLLAERTTRELRKATHALHQLSKGDANTHLMVEGSDELALLLSNLN